MTLLRPSYSSPLDEDWITRQFVLGMFMFAGFTIIPSLLHFQLAFSKGLPFFQINLSHHPPSLQIYHEIQIKNHSICSGCIGSVFSIIITEIIFLGYFLDLGLFQDSLAITYLLFGLFLISVSYSRYLFQLKPSLRLIQHTSLFIGVGFSLIACDLLFSSAFSMVIFLPSWLLFLLGRVALGKWDHTEI